MRGKLGRGMVVGAMLGALGGCAGERASLPPPARAEMAPPIAQPVATVSFQTQIRPLLESRCSPCHFAGGTMYEKLPFDRAGTLRALGVRVFTRITDERERVLIRAFLEQAD